MRETKPKLLGSTPVGQNGQTVVPAKIRALFKRDKKRFQLGWFMNGRRIVVAPMKKIAPYSIKELEKLNKLAGATGGNEFKNAQAAKDFLADL